MLSIFLYLCFLFIFAIGAYYFKNPKVVGLIPGNYDFLGFETMVEESDIIAIVETKERYRQRKKMDGYMQTDIKIQKLIKSNDSSIKKGDKIALNEFFYLEWFRILLSTDYKPLTRNENYLLFIGSHPTTGNYYVVNQNSGRYQITGEETVKRFEDFEEEVWDTYKDEIEDTLKNEVAH